MKKLTPPIWDEYNFQRICIELEYLFKDITSNKLRVPHFPLKTIAFEMQNYIHFKYLKNYFVKYLKRQINRVKKIESDASENNDIHRLRLFEGERKAMETQIKDFKNFDLKSQIVRIREILKNNIKLPDYKIRGYLVEIMAIMNEDNYCGWIDKGDSRYFYWYERKNGEKIYHTSGPKSQKSLPPKIKENYSELCLEIYKDGSAKCNAHTGICETKIDNYRFQSDRYSINKLKKIVEHYSSLYSPPKK